MRFEHILQLYWSKGFFFGGRLFYTNIKFNQIFNLLPGLNTSFRRRLISRLEITTNIKYENFFFNERINKYTTFFIQTLNRIFSQVSSVNNQLPEVLRLIIIHKYLIKSYKGRCHAVGKPVRGQRTWSNSWNSYNLNKILRVFIGETFKLLEQNKREEKINYKMTKKKYVIDNKRKKSKIKVKKKIWF